MAVNQSRSSNAELAEGMSDSRYTKVNPDRGGAVERTTYDQRRDLMPGMYGIVEAREKHLPDGTVHTTPEYVSTPAPLQY